MISREKCNQKAPACAKKPVPWGRNILQVQQHISPENVAARFHRQIAVIPVHGSFDGNKADALSVMLGGVQNAALLFQHAIVAVLHHQAHHGRAEHPGQHLDLPFFRRQLLAGMERIFQQVAKNGAQVGLRQGQELGQFQLPFDLDALFPGLVVVVAGKRIHRSVDAQGGSGIAEFALVLAQVAFQFIQPPGLGQAGDHMQVLAEIVPQVAGLFQIAAQLHIAAGLHGQQLVFAVQLGAAGILLCHAVHLVQQQKDAQQRDALFGKIKNIFKNMHSYYCQFFFRELIESGRLKAIGGKMPEIPETTAKEPEEKAPDLPPDAEKLEEIEDDTDDADDAEAEAPAEDELAKATEIVRQNDGITQALLEQQMGVTAEKAIALLDELETAGVIDFYDGRYYLAKADSEEE